MEILTHKEGNCYVIKLRGELDATTSDAVEKVLDQVVKLTPKYIEVDCKHLKYISSRGLGVFISRYQEIQEKEISFSLHNVSNSISNIFKVLGLDNYIDINPNKAANPLL